MTDRYNLFAEVYNDTDRYPTIADVATALDKSRKTVKNRAADLRARARLGELVPKLISRSTAQNPMSEENKQFMDAWGPDECIAELRGLQAENPDRHITRNFFRANSRVSDSTWNRYFGTFNEYRRQAGLELSRPQHRLELNIARHAAVDHYRDFAERHSWGSDYAKDRTGRFKTLLVCSDLHDIEVDPFYLRVLLDVANRAQPDGVVFGGDVFDLAEFGRYRVDPRQWDVAGRIQFVHQKIFAPLRASCPESFIDFIEGNHEARLLIHLCDQSPAMRVLLSDLHGWDMRRLLGLDEFEINYVSKADLSAWSPAQLKKEMKNNWKVYYDAFFVHHFPEARTWGLPGCCGHHHRHLVWSEYTHLNGSYEFHQLGCGHVTDAAYCEGRKWNMGFSIVNIDTHTRAVNFDYVPITTFAVAGGKSYVREESEKAGVYADSLSFFPKVA